MNDRPRHRPRIFDLFAYTMALIGGHSPERALPMPPPKLRVPGGQVSYPRSRPWRPSNCAPPELVAKRQAKRDRRDERARLAGLLPKKDCACSNCLDLLSNGWAGRIATDPPNTATAPCPQCSNTRCPKARWHRYRCTWSNEVGQLGEIERRAS